MDSSQPLRRIDDPSVLKAMAHPLRQRLFRVLAQLGPATVGGLASHVDGDPGRVSYHLRELAKGGFIEQAPELSRDRRETWWRAIERSTSWSREDFPTPDGEAIYDAVNEQMHADQFDRLRRFATSADEWDPEWRRAALSSQSMLQLTAEELRELASELQPIFERWSEAGHRARDAGDTEGRESVLLFLHAFPDRP